MRFKLLYHSPLRVFFVLLLGNTFFTFLEDSIAVLLIELNGSREL